MIWKSPTYDNFLQLAQTPLTHGSTVFDSAPLQTHLTQTANHFFMVVSRGGEECKDQSKREDWRSTWPQQDIFRINSLKCTSSICRWYTLFIMSPTLHFQQLFSRETHEDFHWSIVLSAGKRYCWDICTSSSLYCSFCLHSRADRLSFLCNRQ